MPQHGTSSQLGPTVRTPDNKSREYGTTPDPPRGRSSARNQYMQGLFNQSRALTDNAITEEESVKEEAKRALFRSPQPQQTKESLDETFALGSSGSSVETPHWGAIQSERQSLASHQSSKAKEKIPEACSVFNYKE